MSTMKRIISFLLALVMVLGMLPWDTLAAEATEHTHADTVTVNPAPETAAAESTDTTEPATGDDPGEITRAQWIQTLVDTFSMTVEGGSYPDNYFSDLTGDEEYYRDILVAVEFGVIDIEAGQPFNPEGAATREFAAHTLNFCLGFQLESQEYSFSEAETVTYPDDIQVAVNRGWFALADGAFLPEQPITQSESDVMTTDAAAVLENDVIDESYENSYEFSDEVIELSENTVAQLNSESELVLANPETAISEGDIFVVYLEGFPVVYQADTVTVSGALYTISVTQLPINEYLTSVDAQGLMEADLADFEVEDDFEAIYILDDGTETTDARGGGFREVSSIMFFKEINGYKVNIEVNNMVFNWRSKGSSKDNVDVSGVVTGTMFCNVAIPFGVSASDFSDVLTLGTIPIGPFGRVSVTANLSIDGSVSVVYGAKFSAGVSYSTQGGWRIPMTFEKTRFSLTVEANVNVGITASVGLTGIPLLSATCRASIGMQVNCTMRYRGEDSNPTLCIHTDSWLYARAGAYATVGVKGWSSFSESWSKEIVIWDRNTSPVRSVTHFEDGTIVGKCTCGDTSFGGYNSYYYSSSGSKYANGGVSSVYNAPTYTYTTDDNGNATITGYSGAVSSLSIPCTIDGYPVTAIGDSAFSGNTSLYSVTIPSGVVTIGASAFENCTGLKNVTIPDTVTSIGACAFRNCYSLLVAEIPDSVVAIQPAAFGGCRSLRVVSLSSSLTTLGSSAFHDCDSLTEITLPKTIDNIPSTQIYDYPSMTYGAVFAECDNLKDVYFEDGTITIHRIMNRCNSIETISIPATVTEIGHQAFQNCTSLKTVDIPNSVIAIQPAAFGGCIALSDVILPPNLTTLGSSAFHDCDSLTEITLPKTIDNIPSTQVYDYPWMTYGAVFAECDNLRSVEFEDGTCKIYRIMNSCPSVEEITIPSSVTEIGDYAFAACTKLKVIEIPTSITSIGSNAFSGCAALKEIIVPDSVSLMGTYCFANCTSLIDVTLPSTRVNIAASMFENCTALEKIILPSTVTTIQNDAFRGCTALKEVVWSESMTTISDSAFNNCDALTSITIPYGVTSIGNSAFYDCDALETVDMANSVTSLGTYAFYHCDVLKDVKLSRNLATVPSYCFSQCAELEEIVIPYFTTKIDTYAFNSSPKLVKVVTRPKLATIDTTAFSYADRTVFYGAAESYTQTWCTSNGYSFVENTAAATAVTVRDSALTLAKGTTKMLDIDIVPNDFADTITFKSGNTAVATVSESGEITAVGTGTTTIKVIAGDCSASCKVTVTQAVTKIALNKTTLALDVPNTYQLTATVTPADATNQVLAWTSSNEAAATVDENGLVKAVGNGTAVITATATDGTGISASCTVTVVDPDNIPVSKITLDKSSLSLEALETYGLTATVTPSNAANQKLNWSSSDDTVATVEENGLVTALAKGTAVITAAATDESGVTASCTVTVNNTAYVAHDVSELESNHDYPNNCSDFWVYTHAGAESLQVTFDAQTMMEDGFDYLYIYDGVGNLIGTYTGAELAGQTVEIPGNTVKIQLRSDDSGTEWGFKVTAVEASAHQHSYVSVVTEPTCTEQGYTTYTCACGDSYVSDYTDALGHEWDDGVVITEATEHSSGLMRYTCLVCGETEDEIIPVLEHTHSYTANVTAPTCTEQGYTTYTCACGDSYVDDYTDPLGHEWDDGVVITEATEDSSGLMRYTCLICGETKDEIIPALEHTHSYTATVTAPTCTEQGYTTYTCACGDSYTDSYIPATGHSYESVVTAPTCTEQGYTTHTCSICGDSYKDTYVDSLGHDWDNGVVTREPTETTEGERLYTCRRCSATKRESIPVKDHVHSYTSVVTAPTCTEQGYTTYTCACGDSYVSDYTDALGHDWQNGTCIRCGAEVEISFTDVPTDAFFYEPVIWAVEQGITNGYGSADTFAPDVVCNRGQVVTFLWRAAGQPEPSSSVNPFTDIKESDYFYKAVLWAVEEGITAGYGSDTIFNPNGSCTRGQVATFLWRFFDQPQPESTENPFTDVKSSEFYYTAVLWAAESGITAGYGNAYTFAPNMACNRGQVVTFLYRAMN